MKAKYLLLLVACLSLLPAPTQAKTHSLTLGINHTRIDAAPLSQSPGLTFGQKIVKCDSLYQTETEFNLIYTRTEMYNKLGMSYEGYVGLYDFEIHLVYLQFPLLFKFRIPNTRSKLYFYTGPSVMLCMHDYVKVKNQRTVFNPDYSDQDRYQGDYDISFTEDPGIVKSVFDSSTLGFIFGFDYNVSGITSGLRYTISTLRQPEAIKFEIKLHTVTLMVFL